MYRLTERTYTWLCINIISMKLLITDLINITHAYTNTYVHIGRVYICIWCLYRVSQMLSIMNFTEQIIGMCLFSPIWNSSLQIGSRDRANALQFITEDAWMTFEIFCIYIWEIIIKISKRERERPYYNRDVNAN